MDQLINEQVLEVGLTEVERGRSWSPRLISKLESFVATGSPLQGRRVADIPWPSGALLVAIERDERLIVPSGGVSIQAGDRISVLADPDTESQVRTLVEGATGGLLAGISEG